MEDPGMKTAFRIAAVALALVTLAGGARAQLMKSDTVVKAEATADKVGADGAQAVTITLTIDKGWHVYANPAENADLTDSQTTVSLTSKNKLDDVKITYPAGTLIKDKVVGDYRVYEDKVTIKATVRRAKGDTEPIDVAVKLQACNDSNCLAGATIKLTAK
jgi:DsbC/DsbD-like thiol-disulfide interchange protein